MSFNIPTSSIGLPISGSRTFRRACRISSFVGMTCSKLLTVLHRVDLQNTEAPQGRRASPRNRGCENGRVAGPKPLDVHKALADDTRFRLYRYVGLAGRPVSVREMSRRLSLHPNTLRPHLRRLGEAGLISRELRKTASVGRPQTLYRVREVEDRAERDYRL